MANILTVGRIFVLDRHNLNRDGEGAPKNFEEGGVTRSYLSSQSINRRARLEYERARFGLGELLSGATVRTIDPEAYVLSLVPESEHSDVATAALSAFLKSLTAKATVKDEGDNDDTETAAPDKKKTLSFYTADEIHALADAYRANSAKSKTDISKAFKAAWTEVHSAGRSLSLAAWGRMFAASDESSVRGALAVAPLVTTHEATISMDYFTGVSDNGSQGAAHMGYKFFTSGVYYGSVSLDIDDLARNWSTLTENPALAKEELRVFFDALLTALPQGNSSRTGAQSAPVLLVAEHKKAQGDYDFHAPIASDESGYINGTVDSLAKKVREAREFRPGMWRDDRPLVAGSQAERFSSQTETDRAANFDDFIELLVGIVVSDKG